MKCYCQSCIDIRERKPECREIQGHIVTCSDEGTIGFIPVDLLDHAGRPFRPERRNWLKLALR